MTLKVLLLCINWQTQLQKRQKDQEHTGNGIELVRQADNAECSWVVHKRGIHLWTWPQTYPWLLWTRWSPMAINNLLRGWPCHFIISSHIITMVTRIRGVITLVIWSHINSAKWCWIIGLFVPLFLSKIQFIFNQRTELNEIGWFGDATYFSPHVGGYTLPWRSLRMRSSNRNWCNEREGPWFGNR